MRKRERERERKYQSFIELHDWTIRVVIEWKVISTLFIGARVPSRSFFCGFSFIIPPCRPPPLPPFTFDNFRTVLRRHRTHIRLVDLDSGDVKKKRLIPKFPMPWVIITSTKTLIASVCNLSAYVAVVTCLFSIVFCIIPRISII